MSEPGRNPFLGRLEGRMFTQDMHECDLCGELFAAAFRSSMTLVYADQSKVASAVCPNCMARLGFQPRKTVPLDQYERMEDALNDQPRAREIWQDGWENGQQYAEDTANGRTTTAKTLKDNPYLRKHHQ